MCACSRKLPLIADPVVCLRLTNVAEACLVPSLDLQVRRWRVGQ